MTESEAKGFVQGKLDCMNKCDIFNKEDKHSDNDCDNCEYCYSQGNFGQQKEAFEVSIKALEKQIPKKPKKIEAEGYRYTDTYRCPICGGNFSGTGIVDYCYHCGQKLDWSDEE